MKKGAKISYYILMVLFSVLYLYHIVALGFFASDAVIMAKENAPWTRPGRGEFIEHYFYSESAAIYSFISVALLVLIAVAVILFYRKSISTRVKGLLAGGAIIIIAKTALEISTLIPKTAALCIIELIICAAYFAVTMYYAVQDLKN